MSAFVSTRGRYEYATLAIEDVEEFNCRFGCRRAVDVPGTGPGGACDVLARMCLGGGEIVPEIDDDGERLTCLVREPWTPDDNNLHAGPGEGQEVLL